MHFEKTIEEEPLHGSDGLRGASMGPTVEVHIRLLEWSASFASQ